MAPERPEPTTTVLGVTYHLVAGDLYESLRQMGIRILELPPSSVSTETFEAMVRTSGASAILGINFSPEVAWLASRTGLRYVSWTIDPLSAGRLRLLPGTDPSRIVAFVHRRSLIAALRDSGLGDVAWLPLAAAVDRRHPIERSDSALDPYRCGASFVGTSLADTTAALAGALRELSAEHLQTQVDRWLHHVARRDADGGWQGFVATASALPSWLQAYLPDSSSERHMRELLDGQVSCLLRFERVSALVRAGVTGGVAVWGDEGMSLSARGAWRGAADHGATLTHIFNASTVNVDLPRVHQRDLLTMRVYDVLACGALALVERSAVEDSPFIDGRHLATYSTTRDLVERALYYAARPGEAATLGSEGRRAVLEGHTMAHRAATVARALGAPPP